jgi:hypothetical protein
LLNHTTPEAVDDAEGAEVGVVDRSAVAHVLEEE